MKLQMNILIAALLLVAAPIRAGIVVDHEPNRSGGPGSDTAFSPVLSPFLWGQVADPVNLSTSATIQQVTWWGWYGGSLQVPAPPPPAMETLRIRLYGSRSGDGLPDNSNILLEQSYANAGRTATGRGIAVGDSPPEYRYQVNLTTPITLNAGVPYWLEIIQVGDPTSDFDWESSSVAGNFAYSNNIVGDWTTHSGLGNVAFQLSTTPEPASGILLLMTAAPLLTRRRIGEQRRRRNLFAMDAQRRQS